LRPTRGTSPRTTSTIQDFSPAPSPRDAPTSTRRPTWRTRRPAGSPPPPQRDDPGRDDASRAPKWTTALSTTAMNPPTTSPPAAKIFQNLRSRPWRLAAGMPAERLGPLAGDPVEVTEEPGTPVGPGARGDRRTHRRHATRSKPYAHCARRRPDTSTSPSTTPPPRSALVRCRARPTVQESRRSPGPQEPVRLAMSSSRACSMRRHLPGPGSGSSSASWSRVTSSLRSWRSSAMRSSISSTCRRSTPRT